MADLELLDDTPQATPLDLLINAISGSGQYSFGGDGGSGEVADMAEYLGEGGIGVGVETEAGGGDDNDDNGETGAGGDGDGGDGDGATAESSRKRPAEAAGTPRAAKIARTLEALPAGERAFSTVEVWHPKTGQKSYGKERRILQPPPTLRVTGPLASMLSTVTLSSQLYPEPLPGPVVFSSQTYRIGDVDGSGQAPEAEADPKRGRKNNKTKHIREAASRTGWGSTLPWERSKTEPRPRSELETGLPFSGLWVGEDNGKSKKFSLELSLGQPGIPGISLPVENNPQPVNIDPLLQNEQVSDALPQALPEGLEENIPDTLQERLSEPLPEGTPLDDAALRRVLGAAEMGPLMSLGDATQDAAKLVGLDPEEASRLELDGHENTELAQQVAALEPMADPLGEPLPEPIPPVATELPSEPLAVPADAPPDPAAAEPPTEKAWARFASDPLRIVSKPSQKTARARSIASCLSENDAFALLVRVNGQTVRTKFMSLDSNTLTARGGQWSPFRFHIVERAKLAVPLDMDKGLRPRFRMDSEQEKTVVTYGSIVQLVDIKNGTHSDPFRLVRVDKNEVVMGADHGHPVSELQRIGLVRVVDGKDDMEGGSRWYLSSPGAVAGAGEVAVTRKRPVKKEAVPEPEPSIENPPETLGSVEVEAAAPARRPKKKTKRYALARAAISEEEQGSAATGLIWHRSKQQGGEETVTEGTEATAQPAPVEIVDDWMCWVLSGVWCFSYSIFNGLDDSLPHTPLNTVPRLLVPPSIRLDTVDLTLPDFFVPDHAGQPQPYSVYLGPLGPLPLTIWRSVAPKEKYYEPGALHPAYPYSGDMDEIASIPVERRVYSNFPYSIPHVIANVQLPPKDEIIRAMEGAGPQTTHAPSEPQPEPQPEPDPEPEQEGWLGVMEPATELTIQEAIHNAGKTHPPGHDVGAILPSEPKAEEYAELGGLDTIPAVTSITMHHPNRHESLSPLPIILVRPDGVGHGIGWSAVAPHHQSPENAEWGIQFVQSALGQHWW